MIDLKDVAQLQKIGQIGTRVIGHFKNRKTGRFFWSEYVKTGATEVNTVDHAQTVQDTIDRLSELKFKNVTHIYRKEIFFNLIRRRTDILLESSDFSVAVECQLSSITPKKLLERTQDYLKNDLDVIWIFKHHSIISKTQEKFFEKLIMYSYELKKSALRFTFDGIGDGILITNVKNKGYRGDDIFNDIELIDPRVYNLGRLNKIDQPTLEVKKQIIEAQRKLVFKEIDKLNLDYKPLTIKGYESWFYYKEYPSNDKRFTPDIKFITPEGEFKIKLK